MSSKQVRYLFTSGDGRQIEVRGFLVRDDAVAVNAPPVYNAAFLAQPVVNQTPVVNAGAEVTETVLTQYAKDHGYTLTRSSSSDDSPTSLNAELTAAPTLAVAADDDELKNNLSWTGSLRMEVWRSVDGNGNFQLLATMGAGGTAYVDAAITERRDYYYKVRVTDTTKVGAFSNVVSITAVDNTP